MYSHSLNVRNWYLPPKVIVRVVLEQLRFIMKWFIVCEILKVCVLKIWQFITYDGCPLLCSFPLLSSVTADVLWRSEEPWSAQWRITTQEETQALWEFSIPSLHQLSGKEHLQILISSCKRGAGRPSESASSVSRLLYMGHLAFSWNTVQTDLWLTKMSSANICIDS